MSTADKFPNFHREKQHIALLRSRLLLIVIGFSVLYIALAARATDITMISSKSYIKVYSPQKRREFRPEIVDRNGELLATNLKVASLYANPTELLDVDEAALALSTTLPDLRIEDVKKDLQRDSNFAWIKRNITPAEQEKVIQLGIPGIYFASENKRVYPTANLLAHTIGYVDIDNNGLAGVERAFEDMEISSYKGDEKKLELSVDLKVQHILHDELSKQMEAFQAIGAIGLVVDTQTGEILSLVSLPDFDPNFPKEAKDEQKFNRATLGTYEMGSTFKPFTAAMAFEYGTATPESLFDATRPLQVYGHTISDYHAKGRVMSVTEVIAYSSNIGTAKIAMQVGVEKQKAFLKKLGLFGKTEVEILEVGKTQMPKQWKEINMITISFGHGIAITPLNLMRAFLPMVNGGKLIPLTLLKRKDHKNAIGTQVISEKTSKQIIELLRQVVLIGSGKNSEVKGYSVGGKTGTAEKLTKGRYDGNKVISSFLSTFPTSNPKYAILAIFDEPKQQKNGPRPTGGIVAAPVVHNVINRIAPMLAIKPIAEPEPAAKAGSI